jgi:peptidyl-prolyl cis-trans isomerase C
MTSIKLTLLAVAATIFLLPVAQAADSAPVATVNGKAIKQSLVDFILKDASASGQKIDDNTKAVVVNKLISQELVLQEAQKAGVDKQADYQAKEDLMRRELMINTYLQDYLKKNPIDEAATKAAYEKFKAQVGNKEFNARHILVKTEAEAKDVIAQLAKGGDFAKLAKEKSIDPGSKDKGGELGWFSPASMVRPFSDAVSKLQKGLYTTVPVQTQFGWHVIKLEDIRDMQPPAYEQVKENIQKDLQQKQLEKLLNDLRSKAKIVDNTAAKTK